MIPISPAFQYRAFVGHALMHSLHSSPWHVRLLMLILPSLKYCLTPVDSRSSSLLVFFDFLGASDIRLNMSMLEGVSGGIWAVIFLLIVV